MIRVAIVALAGLALVACQPKAKEAEAPPAPPPAAAPAQPGAGTITGEILAMEDAGYPMFTVKVKAADGAEKDLLLNAELVDLNGMQPDAYKGKKAQVDYLTESKPFLLGLTLDGKSVLKDSAQRDGEVKTVTGVLGGAAEATRGDLPDQLTVSDSSGQITTFEFFVDQDLVKANGKTVTASYVMQDETRITAIKLAP